MSFRAIFGIWKSKKSIFDQKLAQKFMFFRKNIQISENRSTWRHQTRFFALVRRSFKSDSWYGRERMSKQAYFLGFLTIYIGGTLWIFFFRQNNQKKIFFEKVVVFDCNNLLLPCSMIFRPVPIKKACGHFLPIRVQCALELPKMPQNCSG